MIIGQLTVVVAHQNAGTHDRSKLKLLVPAVGIFFTPLSLHEAFIYQDARRLISHRRFVPPSFNDIRLILNTAQVMSLTKAGPLELVTFDGDVTLYDDGQSMSDDNPVIPRIIALLQKGTKIGIVTAAGYVEARRYYERLRGLLDAVDSSQELTSVLKQNLIVMGGEASYLFRFDEGDPDRLKHVPRKDWLLEEMVLWQDSDVAELLDVAEVALRECMANMRLDAQLLRKERAVGIIPLPGKKLFREQLEETVLVTQKILVGCYRKRDTFKCSLNPRRCQRLANVYPSVPSMVRYLVLVSFTMLLTTNLQEATTCSLTSVTSLGVFELASTSSVASKEERRFMLAINSCPRVQTISRRAWHVQQRGLRTQPRPCSSLMKSQSSTH